MEVTPLPDLNEFINNMRSFEVSDTNQVVIYEIGMEPKMYPGSFSDWISYDDNEVNTMP